jgi:arginine repressor
MNQKTQRLSYIRKIIRAEYISSQEELITRLEVLDFTTNVTEDAVKMKLDDYTIASQ